MSKLLKKIGRGIKKVFKAVKKVVKKIIKSKIFKAIVIAAAIYFTAGAIAGSIGTAGGAGAGAGASATAASAGVSSAAAAGTAAQVGAGAGYTMGNAMYALNPVVTGAATGAASTATTVGSSISSLLGAAGSGLKAAATWATKTPANAILASTGMNIAGTMIGQKAASDAQFDQYKREKREYDTNTGFNLNVADRLAAIGYPGLSRPQYTSPPSPNVSTDQTQQISESRAGTYANTGYYDPTTDTYRNI